MATKIEWTDETWNPVIGCSRVSPGCDHCYAVGVVHRQMSPQHVGLTVKPTDGPTDWNGTVRLWEPALAKPLGWRKPRRVFVNSLSDLFHPRLSDGDIARVFAVMALAPQHTFQVLTKRPRRMAETLADPAFPGDLRRAAFWRQVRDAMTDIAPSDEYIERLGLIPFPLPNVWLGTSIESDRYAFRADHLRRTPAAVRFISAEPLLGPLPSLDLGGIDWLIVGGESGPGARPMHPDWVRDLRDRCVGSGPTGYTDERCPKCSRLMAGHGEGGTLCPTGPAFFFKQWGDWELTYAMGADWVASDMGTDPVRMARVGKKSAGRELDGRTWDEMPKVTP